jgi:hypothetical protein
MKNKDFSGLLTGRGVFPEFIKESRFLKPYLNFKVEGLWYLLGWSW